jgi:hypothetical protein
MLLGTRGVLNSIINSSHFENNDAYLEAGGGF